MAKVIINKDKDKRIGTPQLYKDAYKNQKQKVLKKSIVIIHSQYQRPYNIK